MEGLKSSAAFKVIHLSLLDSYAQLQLVRGRHAESEALLDEIARLNPAQAGCRPSWLDLWTYQTRIWLRQAQGRWADADALASEALEIAASRGDDLADAMFRILKTDALIRLRDPDVGATLAPVMATCHSSSLDTVAELERVKAAIEASLHHDDRAAQHFDRAQRIADTLGNACLRLRIETDRQSWAIPETPEPITGATVPVSVVDTLGPVLDGVASLLELAPHGRLLGREAIHLLDRLGYPGARSLLTEGTVNHETGGPPADADDPRSSVHIPLDDEGLVLRVGRPTSFAEEALLGTIRKLITAGRDLERFAEQRRRRASLWNASTPDAGMAGGVFVSATTLDILDTARKVASTDIPVLLTGETGTGKELLARAIHDLSNRKAQTFLPFDCNSVPRDLLDSQLFGHQRGAFTGAHEPFAGVIRSAEGGTLFLDEIGEISPAVQPKLLRFLETRQVHPIGAPSPVPVDVRVIAATNADLDRLINEGLFREDLYYRLNVIRLRLPPLRERREEIPPLLQHFLEKHAATLERPLARLADETLEYLLLYRWPGNVRELGNEVSRLVALAEPGTTIGPELLSPHIRATRRTIPRDAPDPDTVHVSMRQTLATATDHLERAMIAHALASSDGRLEAAAGMLGLSRKGLYLKRQRLGLAG